MTVSTEQKVDLLLKKLGYTKSKTGSVFGTGALADGSTGKQPFGEAIPSPLIVANGSLWNESDSIPATPPGSDTNQVKRYPATSALRMTMDTSVTERRSYIAYSTYNNTSSTRLTNWIDTQFGPDYQIEVYVDDATVASNKLPEGGSGNNDGWYYDYSAGVLNFNDQNRPSGVDTNGTNVYIVGYRYIGQTGAPTSGISTYSFLDLTVERNLDVGPIGGISTFRNSINALDIIKGYKYTAAPYSGTTTTLTVTVASKVSGEHRYHGQGSGLGYVIDGLQSPFFTLTPGRTYRFDQSDGSNSNHQIKFYLEADKTTLYEEGVTYNGSAGNSGAYTQITVSDTTPVVLHYQCINHGYMGNAFQTNANVVNTNYEATIRSGLNVSGVSTFSSNVDINANIDVSGNSVLQGDLDVDGHTNLDNVSIAGVTTMGGNLTISNANPILYLNDTGANPDYHIKNNNGYFDIVDGTNVATRLSISNTGELTVLGNSNFNAGIDVTGNANVSGDLDVDGHTNLDNISVAGVSTFTGDATFSGNVSIGGTLTYEDVTNVDSVGLLTARSGIRVTGGVIEALAGENKIPSLYANMASLPNAGTYHGMFAHVHSTGKGYFSHAGGWYELVNKESDGRVGTGTETYNVGKVIGYKYLAAPYSGTTTTLTVTVASKVSGQHRYHGQGSSLGYVIDGLQSPFFTLTPGNTYRFDQSDNSNSNHQIKFYLESDKTTLYEDGVTYNGTAGNSGAYTQIVVSDKTPVVLHYQCINHGYMGNAFQTNANVVNTNHEATLRGGLNVTGVSTFSSLVDINAGGQANTFKVEDLTDNRIVIAGSGGELEDSADLTFDGTNLTVGVDAVFSGNVSIAGTLTKEDVTNIDSVGLITARSGIRVTGGVIEALAGENKIPSLYANMAALPNAGTYHGMFAHVHSQGKGYFAHGGAWYELVNKELNGTVGVGTEVYNIGVTSISTLNVLGVSTFAGEIDANGRIVGAQLQNVIPFYYDYVSQFPSASTYHGAVAHAHNTGRLYFAHAGWKELVNKEANGTVGTGTERYNIGPVDLTTLDVSGISTFAGNIDINADIDVDGHTNLDNVSIAGVTTTAGLLDINAGGQANTFKVEDLTSGRVVLAGTGGELEDSNNLRFDGTDLFVSGIRVIGGGGGVLGLDIITRNLQVNGISTFIGIATFNNATFHGDIDVDGHTNLDNVSVAGVTTFAGVVEFDNKAKFDSTIAVHDGTTGSNGQYLLSTGVGVTWGSFPTMRTSQTFTASAGQTTFSFTYNVGFLDVYVNGVKLSSSEFTANNGTSVVLAVGSFVGDIVELISFFTTSYAAGTSGLGNIVEDTTPQLGGNLDLFNKSITGTGNINITGIITATTFVGDGSGLTGVIGSGSGVVIKDSGSTVGTAGTINFGNNLSVSAISGGSVTITATGGGGGTSGINTIGGVVNIVNDLDVDGTSNLDNVDIVGITTIRNVSGTKLYEGSGNGSKLFHAGTERLSTETYGIDINGELQSDALDVDGNGDISGNLVIGGDIDVDGHTELDNVNVAGVVTTSDIRSNTLNFKNAGGGATYAVFTNGGSVLLKHNNTDRLETSASGVTVTGTVAATAFSGDGSGLTGITGSGSGVVVKDNGSTVGTAGTINFGETIDVSAISGGSVTVGVSTSQFNVDKLNVSGISTFVGVTTFKDDIFLPETKSINIGNGTGIFSQIGGLVIENGFITNSGGVLNITSVSGDIRSYSSDNFSVFTNNNEQAILATKNGSVALYHDGGNKKIETSATGVTVTGTVTATAFVGDGSNLTGISGGGGTNVGITTNLSGSFTANAGSPSTINTYGYSSNDRVVEYTILIEQGANFQSQKVLAMRSGTTVHSTQFAVMFSSSLLVQCDVIISGGNMLLRATPETGISGSTGYKIKREVM